MAAGGWFPIPGADRRADPLSNPQSLPAAGNLSQFTDRRGKVTTFTYDGLNRKTFAGFGTQAGPTYESTVTYSYDAGDRLTQAVDSITGTITRGYDGLDRLTSEVTPQGTVSYTYDGAGRRTSMTVAGQSALNYTYDNANRLMQITQGTSTVSFTFDAANRRASLTLPNGVAMSYSYDTASQLTGLTYALGSSTLGNLAYSYDLTGRRAQMGGSFARTGLPAAVSSTSYDASNQLTQWGTAALTYDASGNMLSSGTDGYTWNARNELVSTLSGASFQYDSFGRRISKTVGGITTSYLYDGISVVQELSGATVTANLLTSLGLDEVFVRTDAAGAANLLAEARRATLALTNSTGALQTQYTYEPFGNAATSGAASSNPYQYTGRENDGTGLYFYRARYYNPTFQRFVSEDPLGFRGGINLYAYAENDPVTFVDPLGLVTCTPIGTRRVSWWFENWREQAAPGSKWTFLWSHVITPEARPFASPAGTLVCMWEHEIIRETWQTALFMTTYRCVEKHCRWTDSWYEFDFERRRQSLGSERRSEKRETRTPLFPPVEDEFLNRRECLRRGPPPL